MSARPSFRFYAELNDHLPPERRQREFTIELPDQSTVGAVLEILRVPASEVELILVDGAPADFHSPLKGNERVSVYPVFDSIDVGPATLIRQRPQRRMRFVLDVHLGKLAHLLRMLGFDTVYSNDASPGELLARARGEDRILLSRGVKLTEKSGVNAAFRITSENPREQLLAVMERFDLWRSTTPFRRCIQCNTLLSDVTKETIISRLPAKVRALYGDFRTCPTCGRIYWQGTHYAKMHRFSEEILAHRPTDM